MKTRLNSLVLSIAIILSLAVTSGRARAAVAAPQTIASLTQHASRVVRGKVVKREMAFDDALNARVIRTTLDVAETLKGPPISRLVIQQLGVTRDGRLVGIPGDARFSVGEEVVVFVNDGKGPNLGVSFLWGLAQGKFHIDRSRLGEATARRSFKGLSFAMPRGASMDQAPSPTPVPLDTLRTEIRDAVDGVKP